ncbi:hypothetical protein L1987_61924 [Smallanthus sonchifolius]|uniref:Uncharacterized protein n=1 Tax=Smallanthus sonchifolius TaxID=185202 RepID=A0ACB9C902_9ASTR|nr:hypothetical protein L1987_61924 [Smallanthus sonchifolius]
MVKSEKEKKQNNNGNMAVLGVGVKKGPWTPEEDRKWSTIAAYLPRRTDNEIKNYWNSHIKKRMTKMGIDPMTHKPKNGTQLLSSNLNHMAQWEAARLEAEARLVQKPNNHQTQQPSLVSPYIHDHHKTPTKVLPQPYLPCLDVLKVWQGNLWSNYSINNETLQSLISTSNASVATPAMPVNSSCDQTTKHKDQVETEMGPFEEFTCINDANFVDGDPLRSSDFWEEFVDLLDGGWKNITNNFAMIT